MSNSTLGEIMRKAMPGADTAIRIAQALDMPIEWIITGDESPQPRRASEDWIELPEYDVFDLQKNYRPAPIETVFLHRDWLPRHAQFVPDLWITRMPATFADGLPAEGVMILCTDTERTREEGAFLYRYNDMPMVRRFIAMPPTPPGVIDVTVREFEGMELIARVIGEVGVHPIK